MSVQLFRESIDRLLQEAYEGPTPDLWTWFASQEPESGVLGTIRHLTAEQAWAKPPGVSHSVAQHVAHLIYSIDFAMKFARGEQPKADWPSSWRVGPIEEQSWQSMQRSLREAHLRMRMWVHTDEPFDQKDSVTGFIASIAHAAYHLGAIRVTAALVKHHQDGSDPQAGTQKPL
jgi:hypothetical protein